MAIQGVNTTTGTLTYNNNGENVSIPALSTVTIPDNVLVLFQQDPQVPADILSGSLNISDTVSTYVGGAALTLLADIVPQPTISTTVLIGTETLSTSSPSHYDFTITGYNTVTVSYTQGNAGDWDGTLTYGVSMDGVVFVPPTQVDGPGGSVGGSLFGEHDRINTAGFKTLRVAPVQGTTGSTVMTVFGSSASSGLVSISGAVEIVPQSTLAVGGYIGGPPGVITPLSLDASSNLLVKVANTSLAVTGTFWQATQPISGSVSVSNFPATQTISGSVTASQGTAASLSSKWPVQVTDGTNTMPTADAAARALFHKVTDGTNTAAVKAASTAAVAADPALVIAISPNNTVGVTQSTSPWVTSRNWNLSSSDIPSVTQGTAAALSGAWPIKLTDGTNTMPTMDAAARAGFHKVTDGTNTAAVKAASTAAVAADTALVVAVSPNNTIPANVSQFGGSNVVTGTGASGSGIPRVTVSNDSVISSITNALPAGTNVIGALSANQSINNAQVNGSSVVTSVTGVQDVMPRKRTGSTGLSPNYSASHITSKVTTTVTASTAYVSTIVIACSSAGTSWTLVVQDGEGTPKILVPSITLSVPANGPLVFQFVEPVLMTSGISIVTAGTTAGTVDVFVTYWQ